MAITIGERIKELRYEKGWTRRKLAELSGFTETSVFSWERGAYKPSERAIRALEKALAQKLRK